MGKRKPNLRKDCLEVKGWSEVRKEQRRWSESQDGNRE